MLFGGQYETACYNRACMATSVESLIAMRAIGVRKVSSSHTYIK
jgi:hypothetical protein